MWRELVFTKIHVLYNSIMYLQEMFEITGLANENCFVASNQTFLRLNIDFARPGIKDIAELTLLEVPPLP